MLDRERIQLMNQSKFKDLRAKKTIFAIYDLDTDLSGLLVTNLVGKPFITRRFYFRVLLTFIRSCLLSIKLYLAYVGQTVDKW